MMSDVDARIADMVERALQADPDLRAKALQRRAAALDEGVMTLTGRQFHARYVIQAKRRLSSRKGDDQGSGGPETDSVAQRGGGSITDLYGGKVSELRELLDAAFHRSIAIDSVTALDRLFTKLEMFIATLRDSNGGLFTESGDPPVQGERPTPSPPSD